MTKLNDLFQLFAGINANYSNFSSNHLVDLAPKIQFKLSPEFARQ